jgi:HEAT repeat protein
MAEKIETLIADLTCDDILKCQKARRELVSIGPRAVGPRNAARGHKKSWVRWEAAKALGQIGDKAAVQALMEALRDAEFDVRWQAAEAIIRIGPKAIEPLLVLLASHGSHSLELRQAVHHILHDINQGDYRDILKPVMAAVEDSAPAVEAPVVARQALEAIRKKR